MTIDELGHAVHGKDQHAKAKHIKFQTWNWWETKRNNRLDHKVNLITFSVCEVTKATGEFGEVSYYSDGCVGATVPLTSERGAFIHSDASTARGQTLAQWKARKVRFSALVHTSQRDVRSFTKVQHMIHREMGIALILRLVRGRLPHSCH